MMMPAIAATSERTPEPIDFRGQSINADKRPDLELQISLTDTTASVIDTNPCLLVYLANPQDTVAAFSIRIVLDRPDLIAFKTDEADTVIDTIDYKCMQWDNLVCIDSVPVNPPRIDTFVVDGGIDTTGSLLSNWEYVHAVSFAPDRHDIKIVAFAESDLQQPYLRGIPPGYHPQVLFRLRFRVYPDAPVGEVAQALILENLSETNFSDPQGMLIGTITNVSICDTAYCEVWDYGNNVCVTGLTDIPPSTYDTMIVDTFYRYWVCQEWGQDSQGQDSCLEWFSSPDTSYASMADSTSIDWQPWTIWNTETVEFLQGGHVNIFPPPCGEANGDYVINIADVVYMINYIFKSGPPPAPLCLGDASGDGAVNIADGVYLINYIFKAGPDPVEDCCP
jgi:hypothetical protein